MLGFLFGLNTRLSRLQFFLASVALAIVMTAICFFVAAYAFANISPAMLRPEDLMTSRPAMAAIGFFLLATVTLQSMRIRDIGWDPVCVIPAWIALMIVDHVVATRFPALSFGHEHAGTMVGGLVNLALMLALLFWPSADNGPVANSGEPRGGRNEPVKASVATDRLARVSRGAPRPTWS